jgi:hypothetical protein
MNAYRRGNVVIKVKSVAEFNTMPLNELELEFNVGYGKLEGAEAIRAFFELPKGAFDHLFTRGRYPDNATALDVAERLRDFIFSASEND